MVHYRRRLLCRVSHTLPSAFYRALGKEAICRVPDRKNSANIWHSAKRWFAECRALGKKLHSAKRWFAECRALGKQEHCAKGTTVNGRQPPLTLCRVSSPDTRQRGSFAECHFLTLGKPYFFFHFWPPNFFCSPHTIPGTPCSNVAHFSDFFYISLIYFN